MARARPAMDTEGNRHALSRRRAIHKHFHTPTFIISGDPHCDCRLHLNGYLPLTAVRTFFDSSPEVRTGVSQSTFFTILVFTCSYNEGKAEMMPA